MTEHGDPGVDAGTVAAQESVDFTLQRWRHSPAAAAHAPAGHPRQHPALPRAAAAHHQRPAAVSLAAELSTELRKSFRNIREIVPVHGGIGLNIYIY